MLPTKLYETLPFLYLVMGVSALLMDSMALGKLSAALLVFVAVKILKMRYDYRKGYSLGRIDSGRRGSW